MSRPAVVAGVDGAPGGWAVVRLTIDRDGASSAEPVVEMVSTLAHLVGEVRVGDVHALGIDIPIALLDEHPRRADTDARRLLGPRRSSVFPAPLRVVLDAADYDDACRRSRAACGKALSLQAWNLVPKIADVDALVTAEDQDRVVETHPECAFLRMNGDQPLPHAKHDGRGRAHRRALLERHLGAPQVEALLAPRTAPTLDVLDAAAAAMTARHVASGTDRRLGDQRDRFGRRSEIVY